MAHLLCSSTLRWINYAGHQLALSIAAIGALFTEVLSVYPAVLMVVAAFAGARACDKNVIALLYSRGFILLISEYSEDLGSRPQPFFPPLNILVNSFVSTSWPASK